MKKSKEFDNILDNCLERLLAKGEMIEQCLESYPEQAGELKPLLLTALAAKKASAIQPRSEFRARARYEFHSALQAIESKRSRPFLSWQPRWATAVVIVLILILVGGGTVAAASGSMPDESLYQVKLATEQVRLALTPSDISKAQLLAELADKRVAEIIYLANRDKPNQIESVTQRLDTYLARVAILATVQPEEAEVFLAPASEKPTPEIVPTPMPAPQLAPAPSEKTKEEEEVGILAPAPTAEAPQALPEQARGGSGKELPAQANRRAKLKMIMARYAVNHPAALRAVLETAPESVKPALRRAIAVSVAGYERALKTLD